MTAKNRLVPAELPDFPPSAVVDLDVRDDLRAGREPLTRIRAAAEGLPSGAVLHLRTPFQPLPLYALLAGMGFQYHGDCFAADDWSSWFWRDAPVPTPAPEPPAVLRVEGAWDLRGLPAPEPLRLLLERVEGSKDIFDVLLPAWSDLIAGLLADRGWSAAVISKGADGVRVRIRSVTSSTSRGPA